MNESRVEEILDYFKKILDEDPERLNEWERGFIKNVSDQNESFHLSPPQLNKLVEIWMNLV